MISAVLSTGIDFLPVLEQHFDFATVGFNAIYFVRKFPGLTITDALFAQVLASCLTGASDFVSAAQRSQRIQKDIAFLSSLADKHTIPDPSLIIDKIPGLLQELLAGRQPFLVPALTDLLVLAADKSPEICDALFTRPELNSDLIGLSWTGHLLRCRLAILRGSALEAMNAAKTKFVNTANIPQIESGMAELMHRVLEADYETHKEWGREMLMADMKLYSLGKTMLLVSVLASRLPEEDILAAMNVAAQQFYQEVYVDYLLAKADAFLAARPELRDKILDICSMTPEKLAKHKSLYGRFKNVFVD
jgi:hypothetical protein